MGGVAGLAVGALGVYAASTRYPAFRGITVPFRAFLIVSTGTFACEPDLVANISIGVAH